MAITQVRVELPDDQYSQLIHLQEEIRKTTGRKPALSSIILTLMEKGIQAGDNAPVNQNVAQNAPKPSGLTAQPLSGITPLDRSDLLDWEDQLRDRESIIREREIALINNYQIVLRQTDQAVKTKEEALQLTTDAIKKDTEIEVNKAIITNWEREISEKNKQISELKDEARTTTKEILHYLKDLDRSADKGFFKEHIVPFLPVIAIVIISIITKGKSGNKGMGGAEKGIYEMFKNMSPEQQNSFLESLKNIANNKTGNYNPNKPGSTA